MSKVPKKLNLVEIPDLPGGYEPHSFFTFEARMRRHLNGAEMDHTTLDSDNVTEMLIELYKKHIEVIDYLKSLEEDK